MRWSDWDTERIGRRIIEIEFRHRASISERLELVAEFDARAGHELTAHSSTASWLAHQCGLDGRTAREQVRVARRLLEMPKVAEAFGEQRLSYAKVRAITRAAASEDERALLKVALVSTANQLERHVSQLRSSRSADLDVANRGRAKRSLNYFWEEDGSLKFFGRLPADDGAAVVEAIETKAPPCCTAMTAIPAARRVGSARRSAPAASTLSRSS